MKDWRELESLDEVLNKTLYAELEKYNFCHQPSYPFLELRSDIAPVRQPNLDYMAPEYVLTMVSGPASDMFSLGLLIYSVFAKGKTLFECNGELSSFKDNAAEVSVMLEGYLNCMYSLGYSVCSVLSFSCFAILSDQSADLLKRVFI